MEMCIRDRANLSKLEANDTATVNNEFSSKMTTLESSGVTGNLIGNATKDVTGTVENPQTTFKMSIQKNNTGYFVSYTNEAGETVTKKYYDTKALEQLDEDNVYVGFFASRTAKITVTDINLTTVSPENDVAKEEMCIRDRFNLYEEFWKIYTRTDTIPPQYIGENAYIEKSIIGDGTEIYGKVYNSVIGAGVVIEEGTVVRDSIIMNNSVIGKDSIVTKSIIAEDVQIGSHVELGAGEEAENVFKPQIYNSGDVYKRQI